MGIGPENRGEPPQRSTATSHRGAFEIAEKIDITNIPKI